MCNCMSLMSIVLENKAKTKFKVQDVLSNYKSCSEIIFSLNDSNKHNKHEIIILSLSGYKTAMKIEKELTTIGNIQIKYSSFA